MNSIKQIILLNRPKLANSSVRTYVSLINSALNATGISDSNIQNKTKQLIDYIRMIPNINRRKTTYSALYILTGNDIYSTLMQEDIEIYNAKQKEQTKTDRESANWVDFTEVVRIHAQMKPKIMKLMYVKQLSMEQLQEIQSFILLSLCSGVRGVLPRRSLDYSELKLQPSKKYNYID